MAARYPRAAAFARRQNGAPFFFLLHVLPHVVPRRQGLVHILWFPSPHTTGFCGFFGKQIALYGVRARLSIPYLVDNATRSPQPFVPPQKENFCPGRFSQRPSPAPKFLLTISCEMAMIVSCKGAFCPPIDVERSWLSSMDGDPYSSVPISRQTALLSAHASF